MFRHFLSSLYNPQKLGNGEYFSQENYFASFSSAEIFSHADRLHCTEYPQNARIIGMMCNLSRWPMFHVCLLLMSSRRGNELLTSEFKHSLSSLLQLPQEFPCVLSVMVVYCCLHIEPHHVGCFGQQPYFPEVHKWGKDDMFIGWLVVSLKPSQYQTWTEVLETWDIFGAQWLTPECQRPQTRRGNMRTFAEAIACKSFAEEAVRHCKYRGPCLHLL